MKHSSKTSQTTGLTIVIKVGTTSICDETSHFPILSNLSGLVETVLKLKSLSHRVVVVTSAAVGTGLRRLNIAEKPSKLAARQAIAAVGQGRLMALYDDLFGQFNQPVAQVLLTKNDLTDRSQYLNAVSCFEELLSMGVVPIINENDTISTQGIRFGDNDTLAAVTAGMIKADYLFLMTDVDCLYTDNPRTNPDAQPVLLCDDVASLKDKVSVASGGSALGTGGMITKLVAADLATAAGVATIITHGSKPDNIYKLITSADDDSNKPLHTKFTAKNNPMLDRKWWILHGLHTAGTIYIDAGAAKAVVTVGVRSSLFAAGIVDVQGTFNAHQAVQICLRGDEGDIMIGKGLANYSSAEISRIKRCNSSEIAGILGYVNADCVVHRDNLVRVVEQQQIS